MCGDAHAGQGICFTFIPKPIFSRVIADLSYLFSIPHIACFFSDNNTHVLPRLPDRGHIASIKNRKHTPFVVKQAFN